MRPETIRDSRILFAALNWGMGHVARSIPLLKQLVRQGNQLVIAGNMEQNRVFYLYLESADYLLIDDYPFQFSGKGNFSLDLLMTSKALRRRLRDEQIQVEKIVDKYKVDLVISDHRYGFISNKVPSICLTHQLNLPVRWFEGFVNRYHQKLLRRFSHLWIPDFENSELAGELSRNHSKFQCSYIGPLSRFSDVKMDSLGQGTVVIVSGPDPYNQQLIDQVISMQEVPKELTIIAPSHLNIPDSYRRVESDNWLEQDLVILHSAKIITRSGYSSIMDNYFLNKDILFIPTPGQREQEYLFKLHRQSK